MVFRHNAGVCFGSFHSRLYNTVSQSCFQAVTLLDVADVRDDAPIHFRDAVGTYVVMGLVGIPVFASGGGPGYIAQPTFGYLLGFIVQAWVNGAWARKAKQINFRSLLEANLVGMVIVYLFGLVWFYVVSNYIINAPISVWAVIWYCGILQVIPDVVLCIGAAMLGVRGYKAGIWLKA